MIKQRGFPFSRIVAIRAWRDPVGLRELHAVNLLVAFFALGRRSFEIHVHHARFHVGWLVTVNARRTPMGAGQRKTGFLMIELLQVPPRIRAMASFAACGGAIRLLLQHAIFELPAMRVVMAHRAGAVFEAISDQVRVRCCRTLLVAVAAWNRNVAPGQNEARLFVTCQAKRRWPVALQVVAHFAAVPERCGGKLSLVLVFVAIHALAKGQLVNRVFALWNMTLRAGNTGVLSFQGIRAGGVLFHAKQRRLEALNGVTR